MRKPMIITDRMIARHDRLKTKTAAQEALEFLRRFYPWRIATPLDHAVDRMPTQMHEWMAAEPEQGVA
jgi:hypothetical protein